MATIRELTDVWAETTWKKQLVEVKASSVAKSNLRKALARFGLLKQPITGESVTNLPRTEEGQFPKGLGISYTKAFDSAYSKNPKRLPIVYLLNLVESFDFKNYSEEQFRGLLARGLRTFPSLLRDRDFAENLNLLLQANGSAKKGWTAGVAPDEDVAQHTDVLLKYNGAVFRIWLYQFSFVGLPHDIERILGRRGELPPGNHILCPLDTNLARRLETLEKRVVRFKSRLKDKQAKFERFSNKKCKGALECVKGSEQLEKEIAAAEHEINNIQNKEIIIQNGWYFFAESKVASVLKIAHEVSDSKTKPDDYGIVCKTLLGPEEYLGKVQVFSKP